MRSIGRVAALRVLLKKMSQCEDACMDGLGRCGLPCLVICTGGEFKLGEFVYKVIASELDDRMLASADKEYEFQEPLGSVILKR